MPAFVGVVETGSHKKEESASRMLLGMGKAAPFRKGGFSQALFFPKQNAGGVSRSADRDEGTRTLRYEFASKLTLDSANF